jgi:small subunit ribosomal protein S1
MLNEEIYIRKEFMNRENAGEVDGIGPVESEFERLLDDYRYTVPKQGQILEGEIEIIREDGLLLNVGLKRAALVPLRELNNLDDEFIENLSVGDVIPVYVIRTPVGGENLLVSIEKATRYQNWSEAEKLLNQDESIELRVTGENRGGVLVRFDQLEGFVPNSHIPEFRQIRDHQQLRQLKQEMIGASLLVKPIEVNQDRQRLVFSAAAAQKERRQERLGSLKVGQVIHGTVANVVDFGLFVDLGGIDGLVHISEISWQRVNHPAEAFKEGDAIDVQVLEVDLERQRISLSRKALLPSPWQKVAESIQPGDVIEVQVTHIAHFGVFAALVEGVEGLIHNSEIGYAGTEKVTRTLEVGETVLVKVLNVDPVRRRVSLSMRKVPEEKQLDWIIQQLDSGQENAG